MLTITTRRGTGKRSLSKAILAVNKAGNLIDPPTGEAASRSTISRLMSSGDLVYTGRWNAGNVKYEAYRVGDGKSFLAVRRNATGELVGLVSDWPFPATMPTFAAAA